MNFHEQPITEVATLDPTKNLAVPNLNTMEVMKIFVDRRYKGARQTTHSLSEMVKHNIIPNEKNLTSIKKIITVLNKIAMVVIKVSYCLSIKIFKDIFGFTPIVAI